MGLPYVKLIAETLGGDVRLKASSCQGSTFEIRVPVTLAEPQNPRVEPTEYLPRGLSVVFADDQPLIRKMLAYRLERLGDGLDWTIKGVATAEAALGLVDRERVDVVLLDENMEGAGGFLKGTEAMAKLRSFGFKGVIVGVSQCQGKPRDFGILSRPSSSFRRVFVRNLNRRIQRTSRCEVSKMSNREYDFRTET